LEYEPVPEILQNKIRNIAAVHHAKQKNIFLEILADLGFLAAAGLVRVLYAHPSPVNFLIATVLVTGLLAFFLIEFLQPYFFSYND
jgi:hypothetical protein